MVLTIDTEQATEQDADSLPRPLSAKQQSRHNQIVLNAPSEYLQTSWIDGFSCLRNEKVSLNQLLINSLNKIRRVACDFLVYQCRIC